MPRRLTGSFEVNRRPEGGAVIIFKTPTGESFEFERNPGQIEELIALLTAIQADAKAEAAAKVEADAKAKATAEAEAKAAANALAKTEAEARAKARAEAKPAEQAAFTSHQHSPPRRT